MGYKAKHPVFSCDIIDPKYFVIWFERLPNGSQMCKLFSDTIKEVGLPRSGSAFHFLLLALNLVSMCNYINTIRTASCCCISSASVCMSRDAALGICGAVGARAVKGLLLSG